MINGRIEFMLSKDYGNYKPNLILTKNLTHGGEDMVLVNNFHIKNHVLSASAAYNTIGVMPIGAQYMIKTPNVEFYIGSDQILKSYKTIKNFSNSSAPYSNGYTGFSFYMGFALKFGRVLEHQANASKMPGFKKDPIGKSKKGLLKKKESD
jgi:hypothetical protein